MAAFGADAPIGGIDILGVRFSVVSRNQATEQMLMWIAEKSRRMVITAGPEFVMMTQQDEMLHHITRVADLVTPDGIGVIWAARRAGIDIPERVTGVEMVHDVLTTAAQRKHPLRVFVLGASDASLTAALRQLEREYPIHEFAGRNGYFRQDELPDILPQIEAFEPDLWLVGLGQPRQEKLIFDSLAKLPPCVAIGVGGSIDVWGGTVKRAPTIVQRLNIEWLYRLLKQPSRWRRQLALPRFAWKVLRRPGSVN